MALKDIDQLKAEIDAAVHPNGPLGKTTAPGLNALLQSLAVELTARPEAGALNVAATLAGAAPGAVPTVAATVAGLQEAQYQQPFVFAVSAGGSLLAVATLALTQARALVLGAVPSVALVARDATTGDDYSLTATYDAASAAFALSGTTTDGTALTGRQVGGGSAAPAPATFAGLAGLPADNAALVAALHDEQSQQPFLFALESDAGTAQCLTLSLAQARALVNGTVPSVALTVLDDGGNLHPLTATYNVAQATLAISGTNDGGDPFTIRQVGGGASAPATFAGLAGQPADNAALAAALASKATTQPAPALEFVFEAGFADAIGRTLGPRQAATYTGEQRQNVGSATYQVNGVVVAQPTYQPLTLASGDVLQVAISRLSPAQPAVLTLLS